MSNFAWPSALDHLTSLSFSLVPKVTFLFSQLLPVIIPTISFKSLYSSPRGFVCSDRNTSYEIINKLYIKFNNKKKNKNTECVMMCLRYSFEFVCCANNAHSVSRSVMRFATSIYIYERPIITRVYIIW